MLNNIRVLIAEDEPFIALDIAGAAENARGQVLRLCASVREAFDLLENSPAPHAAILDICLVDGEVTPVA